MGTKGKDISLHEDCTVNKQGRRRRVWENTDAEVFDGRDRNGKIIRTKYHKGLLVRVWYLAVLGLTNYDIAQGIGVNVHTLEAWQRKHPEFNDALCRGRVEANADVGKSLYQRAMGYSVEAEHIAVVKHKDGSVEIVKTPYMKTYPPDTVACIFWLKNRERDSWQDVNQIKNTMNFNVKKIDLTQFTDEQLEVMSKMGLQQLPENADGDARTK